jgi:hypothetical protein
VELGLPSMEDPLIPQGLGLLNHQTSKNSINSFWMKISLRVFKIRGFEGGIQVPKHGSISIISFWMKICLRVFKIRGLEGGPLHSTMRGLFNHQTSKNSINSFWVKNCLRVFKIRGPEGGIGVPKQPLNSTGAGLLNHQTSKISINSFWMKISL